MTTENNAQLVEELNDLVQIQNDRIKGYENAIEDVQEKNTDLRMVFQKMIDTSNAHRMQLSTQISFLGGEVVEGTTMSGKIYRAWMDVKLAVAGPDRENVLETCKHGEEAAQKAYDMALDSDAALSASVRQMLMDQQQELKSQQNEIIALEELADKMD